MLQAPGGGCLFITIFHGPFDVHPLGDWPGRGPR
jgi:hypothetical protein